MSTTLYLTCRQHDPVTVDDFEVGHNLAALEEIRTLISRRAEILEALGVLDGVGLEIDVHSFYSTRHRNAVSFFIKHPRCEIGIRDEYGKDHPVNVEVPADNDCSHVGLSGQGRCLEPRIPGSDYCLTHSAKSELYVPETCV